MKVSNALLPLGMLVLAAFTVRTPGLRSYEVQLAMTGYTGLAESRECAIPENNKGYDSLVGTVKGMEDPATPDEDVVYQGTLRRVTRIDYCQTRPKSSATPDELVWCLATLTAAARMDIELTVDGEDGRGAYLKAKAARGAPDSVKVTGNCLQADMDAIRQDYPSGESGGSPDGQPIAEPANLKFQVAGVRRLRPGYFPPAPPETAWGLRVVRATP